MSGASRDDRSFHVIEAVPSRLSVAPPRPRRRWSDEIKEELVARSLEPGANVSAVARQAGVVPSQLFGWRREAIRKGSETARALTNAAGVAAAGGQSASMIEIIVDGAVIRAGADVSETRLRRVIRAVRSA